MWANSMQFHLILLETLVEIVLTFNIGNRISKIFASQTKFKKVWYDVFPLAFNSEINVKFSLL